MTVPDRLALARRILVRVASRPGTPPGIIAAADQLLALTDATAARVHTSASREKTEAHHVHELSSTQVR